MGVGSVGSVGSVGGVGKNMERLRSCPSPTLPYPPTLPHPSLSRILIQHDILLLRRSDTFLNQRHHCIDILPAEDFSYFLL